MRFHVCLAVAAMLGLAACAESPPTGSPSPREVIVTGSRIRQDPRMLDPGLAIVYPSDGNQSQPYAGAILQRSLWPFVQVVTP